MSVKSKKDLMDSVKAILGENTSDEAIAVIEDISDTVDDFETRTADQTNWKQKFEENDASWRKRYTDRFYGNGDDGKGASSSSGNDSNNGTQNQGKPLTFDNLFKEG